jgi:hypothetical protein
VALPAEGIGLGKSTTKSFLIRNVGKTGNLIGNVGFAQQSSAFTISQTALNVAPHASATEVVTFTPGTAGTSNTGMLVILSNDAKNPMFNVALSGRGLAGHLVAPAAFVIRATPGGPTVVGNLTIRNNGRGLLTVSWPTLTSSATAPYSVTGATNMAINPATSVTIPISFTATVKGRAPTAPFAISVTAPSTGARTVTLRGLGD